MTRIIGPQVALLPGSALLIPGVGGVQDPYQRPRQQLTDWLATLLRATPAEGRGNRVALVAAPAVPAASGKENASPDQAGTARPQADLCAWSGRVAHLALDLHGTSVPTKWWPRVALVNGQLQASEPRQAQAARELPGRCAGCAIMHSIGLYLLWQAGYQGYLEVVSLDQLEAVLGSSEFDVLLGIGDQALNHPQAQVHREFLHNWWNAIMQEHGFQATEGLALIEVTGQADYEVRSWRPGQEVTSDV